MILDYWPTRLRLVLMLVFALQATLAAAGDWSRIYFDARTGRIGGVEDRGRLLRLEFLFGEDPFWELEARVPEGDPWRLPPGHGWAQSLEVRLTGQRGVDPAGIPYCLVWSIAPAGPGERLLASLDDLDLALLAALEAT